MSIYIIPSLLLKNVLITQLCNWVIWLLVTSWTLQLPGSSVHGILQARILEWVAIPFSRGSFWPRNRTQVSCVTGRFFSIWAIMHIISFFFFHLPFFFLFVVDFVIHWNETAKGLHVFPIPIPPPTSLSTHSL